MIPKIIYLYWDYSKLAFLNYLCFYTIKKFNPDYDIILYRPKVSYKGDNTWKTNEHSIKYDGPDYMDYVPDLGIKQEVIDFEEYGFSNDIPETYKADIFRLNKLYETGGFWVDSDIICFKNINSLNLTEEHDLALIKSGHIPQYFLGSSKNNMLIKLVIDNLKGAFNMNDYQSLGTSLLNRLLLRNPELNKPSVKLIHIDLVAPYKYNEPPLLFLNNIIKINDNTLCMHLFNGNDVTKKYSNNLNHDNFLNINNSFTTILKKILDEDDILKLASVNKK